MEEQPVGDFKKPGIFREYGVTIGCALVGGFLAVGLMVCMHRDLKQASLTDTDNAQYVTAEDHTVGDAQDSTTTATEDITDLIGYAIYGEQTLTDEAGGTYDAQFAEDGTVTGSFVPEKQMNYRIEMDEAGNMALILSNKEKELSYTLTYNDQYQMVLSDGTHTYTMG